MSDADKLAQEVQKVVRTHFINARTRRSKIIEKARWTKAVKRS